MRASIIKLFDSSCIVIRHGKESRVEMTLTPPNDHYTNMLLAYTGTDILRITTSGHHSRQLLLDTLTLIYVERNSLSSHKVDLVYRSAYWSDLFLALPAGVISKEYKHVPGRFYIYKLNKRSKV